MKKYRIKIQRDRYRHLWPSHYFGSFSSQREINYIMAEYEEARQVTEKEGKKLIEEIKTIYEKHPSNGKLIEIGLYDVENDKLIEDEVKEKVKKFTRFEIMDI